MNTTTIGIGKMTATESFLLTWRELTAPREKVARKEPVRTVKAHRPLFSEDFLTRLQSALPVTMLLK